MASCRRMARPWLELVAFVALATTVGADLEAKAAVLTGRRAILSHQDPPAHFEKALEVLQVLMNLLSHFRTATLTTLGKEWKQHDSFDLLSRIFNQPEGTGVITAGPVGDINTADTDTSILPLAPAREGVTENEIHVLVSGHLSQAEAFFAQPERYHPRSGFFIVVVHDYQSNASSNATLLEYLVLLRSLWEKQRIPHVLIANIEGIFLMYDPFDKNQNGALVSLEEVEEEVSNPQRSINMQGHELRIAAFTYTARFRNHTWVYTNIRDKKFMWCLGNVTNATIVEKIHHGTELSGTIYPNGTTTGTMKMILDGEADLDYYARPLEYFGERILEFAYPPIEYDDLVIMVHRGEIISVMESVVLSFTLDTWLCFIALYFGMLFVCFLSRRVWGKNLRYLWYSLMEYFCSIPSAGLFHVTTDSERLAIVGAAFASIIITNVLQAVYFRSLTNPMRRKDISTLKELSESSEVTRIAMFRFHESQSIFENLNDPVTRKLHSKLIVFDGPDLIKILKERNHGAIFLESDMKYVMANVDGAKMLGKILEEHIKMNILSYICPYGSPFLPIINKISDSVTESGIILHWYLEYRKDQNKHLSQILRNVITATDLTKGLEQISGAIMAMIYAYVLGCLIFVLEIIFYRKQKAISSFVERRKEKLIQHTSSHKKSRVNHRRALHSFRAERVSYPTVTKMNDFKYLSHYEILPKNYVNSIFTQNKY